MRIVARVARFILTLIISVLALLGAAVVVLAMGGIAFFSNVIERDPTPDAVVLTIDLRDLSPDEAPADPWVRRLLNAEPTLREVVDALDHAATDPRVKGVVAKLGDVEPGFAEVQELAAAIERVRAAGRFTLAYSDSFGELGGGMASYTLASAFETIWMQPGGTVGITGVAAETPFLRGALDRFGIRPDLAHREEYKTFSNTFTETGFTPAHREMATALVGDLMDQMVQQIARGRGMEPVRVRALVDQAPLTQSDADGADLIDGTGSWQDALDHAKQRSGQTWETLSIGAYAAALSLPDGDVPRVALIHGSGPIERGDDDGSPLGSSVMAADRLANAFDRAAADPNVRAILFRIDSGGGSAVGSETIRLALLRAKARGKPVVVSMGDAAASGGYWIAADADVIVALPSTLTGSIGVVGGKFATEDLWNSLGISWDGVAAGNNATFGSAIRPYTASESQRRDALLDEIYRNFLERVAQGRRMDIEAVRAVAGGRVWTGRQAIEQGLVDRLGGYLVAMAEVRRLAGLAEDAPVAVRVFGADEWLEMAVAWMGTSILAGTPLENLVRTADRIGFSQSDHLVHMPDLGLWRRSGR